MLIVVCSIGLFTTFHGFWWLLGVPTCTNCAKIAEKHLAIPGDKQICHKYGGSAAALFSIFLHRCLQLRWFEDATFPTFPTCVERFSCVSPNCVSTCFSHVVHMFSTCFPHHLSLAFRRLAVVCSFKRLFPVTASFLGNPSDVPVIDAPILGDVGSELSKLIKHLKERNKEL